MSGEAAGAGPEETTITNASAAVRIGGGRAEQDATASGAEPEELIDTLRRRTDEGRLY